MQKLIHKRRLMIKDRLFRIPHSAFRTSCRSRRAFTLMELLVATLLFGAVLVTAAPVLGWVIRERSAAERRQLAVEEVANLMETITLDGRFEAVTEKALAPPTLSPQAKRRLKDARLDVKVEEDPKPPAAKRISIELRWRNRVGEFAAPVRLTTWIFRRKETQ